ncbi:hypothetical protein L9F63_009753, partial [Diploptera punctata]
KAFTLYNLSNNSLLIHSLSSTSSLFQLLFFFYFFFILSHLACKVISILAELLEIREERISLYKWVYGAQEFLIFLGFSYALSNAIVLLISSQTAWRRGANRANEFFFFY